ncbi:hypothetical protein EGC76_02850 [Pseudidiomarina gelatinasegens]|jgi:predicted transcriptional regulator|uniref:CBS domain-containing protein n=1 Tax=Pseudidiomarina gelatinasegens TaxID=2487740 RepID=A0A443Z5V5_9GAMM|nr:hypothetical protein [Pseudidiomarina gelatinasegens]RWU12143.1 hypothetical protein EGC76_02850 [Pseudidiomarina gelatinasegens]
MSEFHALHWESSPHTHFLPLPKEQLSQKRLDWHQSAHHIVDELHDNALVLLTPQMPVLEAESIFNASEQRYGVVIDEKRQVIGVLMARELHGRHSGVIANLLQLPWHELTVGYLMRPIGQIPVLNSQQIRAAKIGDIAATMQAAGSDFIVITTDSRISGIVVSLKIMAVTGESIRLYPRATTFAEVFNAIKHPDSVGN